MLYNYPMARRVRAQAVMAEEALEAKLSTVHTRRWWSPDRHEAAPTTPAIREKMIIKPVASFPMGKNNGENENPTGMLLMRPAQQNKKQSISDIWDDMVENILTITKMKDVCYPLTRNIMMINGLVDCPPSNPSNGDIHAEIHQQHKSGQRLHYSHTHFNETSKWFQKRAISQRDLNMIQIVKSTN